MTFVPRELRPDIEDDRSIEDIVNEGVARAAAARIADNTAAGGTTPPPTRATPPKTKSKARPMRGRRDASLLLGAAWEGLATMVVPGFSPAAARGMQFTAPGAGEALDDIVAGTPVDKFALQPFVGVGGKVSGAKDLFTIPMLLLLMERNPALWMSPGFQKGLRRAVRSQFRTVVEVMKQEKALEEELQSAAVELELVEDPDKDILDQIIADLVGPILKGPPQDKDAE